MTYIIQKKLRYLENFGRINETKNFIQHVLIKMQKWIIHYHHVLKILY